MMSDGMHPPACAFSWRSTQRQANIGEAGLAGRTTRPLPTDRRRLAAGVDRREVDLGARSDRFRYACIYPTRLGGAVAADSPAADFCILEAGGGPAIVFADPGVADAGLEWRAAHARGAAALVRGALTDIHALQRERGALAPLGRGGAANRAAAAELVVLTVAGSTRDSALPVDEGQSRSMVHAAAVEAAELMILAGPRRTHEGRNEGTWIYINVRLRSTRSAEGIGPVRYVAR